MKAIVITFISFYTCYSATSNLFLCLKVLLIAGTKVYKKHVCQIVNVIYVPGSIAADMKD